MLRSPDLLRTTTFRWAVSSALAFASAVLLLFGLTYWQTAGYLTRQVDRGLLSEAASFMNGPASDLRRHIEWRLQTDPRHFNVTGLFGPDGQVLAGNIAGMPAGLPPQGNAARLGVSRILADGSQETRTVRVVDERLPDGRNPCPRERCRCGQRTHGDCDESAALGRGSNGDPGDRCRRVSQYAHAQANRGGSSRRACNHARATRETTSAAGDSRMTSITSRRSSIAC